MPAELSRPEEPLRDVQQSCIMVKDGAYIQAYNAQIIAHGVSNQPPDQEYLVPMVGRMLESGAQVPEASTAAQSVRASMRVGVGLHDTQPARGSLTAAASVL